MAGTGPMDDAAFNLANPDGTPNVHASIRFLLTHPWRIPRLARLAPDSRAAEKAAAAAAVKPVTTVH